MYQSESSHENAQVPHASGHASNAFAPVTLLFVLVLQYFFAFFATQAPAWESIVMSPARGAGDAAGRSPSSPS